VKYRDGSLINYIIQNFQQVCLAVKPQYQVLFIVIVQNIVIFRMIQRMVYVRSGDSMLERGRRELDNDFHASILSQNRRRDKVTEKGTQGCQPRGPQGPPREPQSLPHKPEGLPHKPEGLPREPQSLPRTPESQPREPETQPRKPESQPRGPQTWPREPQSQLFLASLRQSFINPGVAGKSAHAMKE
jgi:hypothetical protein